MEMLGNPQRKRDAGRTQRSLSGLAMRALETTSEIFGKELGPNEMKIWTNILRGCSDSSIEWAFDSWSRNGKFFPKPSEIIELIQAFNFTQTRPQQCEPECQQRHGKGYHGNDVVWLFKRYLLALKTDPNAKPEHFMDELDSKRQGGAPEWRKVGGTAAKVYQGEPIRDEEIPF